MDDIKQKLTSDVCPVYVSRISYGRLGYLCIESDDAEQYVKEALNASVDTGSINVNASMSAEAKTAMNRMKVNVFLSSGKWNVHKRVHSGECFS